MTNNCPFCVIADSPRSNRVIFESTYFLAILDRFPVSEGHALLISKQHLGSFFSLPIEQREDVLFALEQLKNVIQEKFSPDGFNIGVNDGSVAGQTIPHLHIHLIPRYIGDMADPRGGIRWIMPDKANYWSGNK